MEDSNCQEHEEENDEVSQPDRDGQPEEDNVKRIQKLMWQMRQDGCVFQSSEDAPSDPVPLTRTLFNSTSRFGGRK